MTNHSSNQDLGANDALLLTLSSEGERVRIEAINNAHPQLYRHATKSSLYAIAVQQMAMNGMLDAVVDALLANGPMSQTDAANTLHRNNETLHDIFQSRYAAAAAG